MVATQSGTFNVSVDVTPFVHSLVQGGAPFAGFLGLELVDGVNSNFVVGEGYLGDRFPPTLSIEYEPARVPEPVTSGLMLLGLAALGGRRRRSSR